MAETRKYDPAQGKSFAAALRAQIGETVRPVLPGEQPTPKSAEPEQAPVTSWVNLTVTQHRED